MKAKILTLSLYGFTHALVDTASAFILFYSLGLHHFDYRTSGGLVLLYALLAFGIQPLLGLAVDALQAPRKFAALGCLALAVSLFLPGQAPIPAICLACIGNALFHLGGGSISLNLAPGRATEPGFFVAPGALGLAAGIIAGKAGLPLEWPLILLLTAAGVAILALEHPPVDYRRTPVGGEAGYFRLILLLLLTSVAVRSLVGLAAVFPWKTQGALLWILPLAVVGGKALGGVLADRFGWTRVAVGALLTSAPLMALGAGLPWLALPGVILFQMTMPVTLVAVAAMYPGRSAFAFGLTCLALFAGAYPVYTGAGSAFALHWPSFGIIICSALALLAALHLFFRRLDSPLKPQASEALPWVEAGSGEAA